MRFSILLAAAGLVTAAPLMAVPEPVPLAAEGPRGDLAGTLIAPAEGRPVVLILPGSGPTDRDGNNPMGVTAAPYRLLAEALAGRGIGTVRIDKRGMFASKAAVTDANAVTVSDYVADTASWVDAARAASGADCIWLLGHSEGGLVALAAAKRIEHLCGLILVATPGRPLGTILREQLSANPANAPILDEAETAITALEAGERVDVGKFHPAVQGLFAPAVQGFLIDLMAQDPAAMANMVELPMLIVQGGTDLQVGAEDAKALVAAAPGAEYLAIPAMNHVLKDIAGGDVAANRASYADPSLAVSPALVDGIAAFITDFRKAIR
ncbi:MAG: alpha/beta hydrolase [Actinobacteria bacterium]|nr:alpha/beta hydrolase [Actinomycetota bacterium]|tara:strand:- start:912 stop:1883 length:972 start_codon:yes stop_codon:yes gene_type:complete